MAAREKERCTRIDYLWRVSHHYSHICPELASFWGLAMRETSSLTINDRFNRGKLLDLAGPTPVTDRLCPGCGALLHPSSLPSSSSVRLRTVSKKRLKKLRRKNDIVWLGAPAPRAKSYMLVKCRCGKSYVTAVHGGMLTSAVSVAKTPKSGRRRKTTSLSGTLKSLLETSSRLQAQRQRQKASPSLSLFLTALNKK